MIVVMMLGWVMASGAMDLSKKRDIWDLHHVSMSCIGTAYLNHVMNMPFWKAALISSALGLAWEGLDEMYYRGKFGRRTQRMDNIFDWRIGFDARDLLRNSLGIAIAFPIRNHPQKTKPPKIPRAPVQQK